MTRRLSEGRAAGPEGFAFLLPEALLPWRWAAPLCAGDTPGHLCLCARAHQDLLLDLVHFARLSPQMPLQKNNDASRKLGSRGRSAWSSAGVLGSSGPARVGMSPRSRVCDGACWV